MGTADACWYAPCARVGMITFVLKVMMLLGFVAYAGGPTDAVLVWSGASTAPVSPCIADSARCAMAKAEVLPLDGRIMAPPGADLAQLEGAGHPLRPALADEFAVVNRGAEWDGGQSAGQNSGQNSGQGGPLFENAAENEAKP